MILYWLIFFLFSYLAYKNWRKTTLIWFPFQLLFNECVCLKYTSPAITLVLAVDCILIFMSYRQDRKRYNRDSFIFRNVLIAYLISYTLSNLLSGDFVTVFTNTLKYFIMNFFYLWILQKAIVELNDFRILIKYTFIVSILIVGLAFYETLMNDNPILDYVYFNTPEGLINAKMYYIPPSVNLTGELQMRYGVARAYSFFHIHIFFGATCIVLLYFFMFFLKQTKTIIKKHSWIFILAILLLFIGAFLSNSKTPIVGLFIIAFSFFSMKNIANVKTILCIIVALYVLLVYFPAYSINLFALFDDNLAQEGGGSSVALRQQQYAAAFDLFLQNPILGQGTGALNVTASVKEAILGLESSWLQMSVTRGLLGVLTYLYLYITIFKKLKPIMPIKQLLGLTIGFMAMETVTGQLNLALFGGLVIIIYKYLKISDKIIPIANN